MSVVCGVARTLLSDLHVCAFGSRCRWPVLALVTRSGNVKHIARCRMVFCRQRSTVKQSDPGQLVTDRKNFVETRRCRGTWVPEQQRTAAWKSASKSASMGTPDQKDGRARLPEYATLTTPSVARNVGSRASSLFAALMRADCSSRMWGSRDGLATLSNSSSAAAAALSRGA